MSTTIRIKRAYEPADESDGYRIYIDRLWPRGLSHATFKYDCWDKSIAPSTELREWFHADPDNRWDEFQRRYIEEIKVNPAYPELQRIVNARPVVTLLYSSHDEAHNNAIPLEHLLSGD